MKKIDLFIIICFLIIIFISFNIENFGRLIRPHYYYRYKLKYCADCGHNDRLECNECHNCGYCFPLRGIASCVPGDDYGPLFREDCYQYEYNYPSNFSYFDNIFKYPNKNYYYDYYNNYEIDILNKKLKKLKKKLEKLEDKEDKEGKKKSDKN